MGRGDRRSSARDVPRGVDRPPQYRVVLANEAMDELVELLSYIKEDGPKNAASVRESVAARLDRLAHLPRTGHEDPNAPLVPEGAAALITTVKGLSIQYLFPLRWRRREIVYVVTIRRGARMPLDEPEYTRRWMEELARIAPPPGAPLTS